MQHCTTRKNRELDTTKTQQEKTENQTQQKHNKKKQRTRHNKNTRKKQSTRHNKNTTRKNRALDPTKTQQNCSAVKQNKETRQKNEQATTVQGIDIISIGATQHVNAHFECSLLTVTTHQCLFFTLNFLLFSFFLKGEWWGQIENTSATVIYHRLVIRTKISPNVPVLNDTAFMNLSFS